MRFSSFRTSAVAVIAMLTLAASGCAAETQSAVPTPAPTQVSSPTTPAHSATPTPTQAPTAEETMPRSTHEPVVLRAITTLAPTTTAPSSAARPVNPPPAGSVDCSVSRCVALTFDDGPGPHTTRLVGMLTSKGARATFFMQGVAIQANPGVARLVANTPGMEIGNHSASHPQLTAVSSDRLRREVVGNHATIKSVTGKDVTVFRPPYGARNNGVDAMAAQAGESVILWDVDTLDWRTRSASATRQAANRATPGSIILMHDIHGSTVDAVPGIITDLQAKGYTLVTVSELLGGSTPGRVYTRR